MRRAETPGRDAGAIHTLRRETHAARRRPPPASGPWHGDQHRQRFHPNDDRWPVLLLERSPATRPRRFREEPAEVHAAVVATESSGAGAGLGPVIGSPGAYKLRPH